MLSLSTAWFSDPEQSTESILDEVRGMGFAAIEWGISGAELDEGVVSSAVRDGEIAVTSVHAVGGLADTRQINARGDDLASTDNRKRLATVDALCRTVNLARRLGARAVVVHAGGIEGPLHERCGSLMRNWSLVSQSSRLDEELTRLRELREKLIAPYLARIIDSLNRVIQQVGAFPLGLESRYYLSQMPLPEELDQIREAVCADCIGYWHDMGHARAMQVFAGVGETHWLEAFRERLIGLHLHDAIGMQDHKPPGEGELDFEAVAERVRGWECIRVMEIAAGHSAEAIRAGREHLERLGLD